MNKRFLNWFEKECKKREIATDKIDVMHEYDRKITVAENKNIFLEKLNHLKPDFIEQVEYVKAQKDKAEAEAEQQRAEAEKDLLDEFRKEKAQKIIVKSFEVPQHFIRMVAHGVTNACILVGGGGLGKTYLTLNTVKEVTNDFAYLNGYVTPLSLYIWLFKNKDKLCILDDVRGLFENPNAISLLKSALWSAGNKRIVHYETTSRFAKDVQSYFEMTGRFIILGNTIGNTKDENIKALISRALFYEMNFTYKEKCSILLEISKTKYKELTQEQRTEVITYVIKNTNPTTKVFNFRTLIKTYDFYLYDKLRKDKVGEHSWRKLAKNILVDDERDALVWKLMKEIKADKMSVTKAINLFGDEMGGSRATFFRIKKRLAEVG